MKYVYVLLGFVSLLLGIIGIFIPFLPTTPFLLLTLFFFTKGSKRLEAWFMRTSVYQNHLKSFNERRAMTKKTKISILALSTPNPIGRGIIAALIAVKYWFFLFWIKTEGESEDLIEND